VCLITNGSRSVRRRKGILLYWNIPVITCNYPIMASKFPLPILTFP
jgi:hypothetical protein